MKRDKIFLYLFGVVSIIQLVSLMMDWTAIDFFIKPLIMLSLVGYYLASVNVRSSVFIRALFFCWAGDVLLLFVKDDETFFITGLLAFLIGQALYIASYRQHSAKQSPFELMTTQKIRYSLPIVLAGTGLIVILFPKLGGLRLPVMVYGIALVVMVMTALFRYGRTTASSFWFVFGGAVLFMISDSLLAINRFYTALAFGGFWIMLTYIMAQYMIVRGIVKHIKT
jgi:uncharacterized membrane protein YhhN